MAAIAKCAFISLFLILCTACASQKAPFKKTLAVEVAQPDRIRFSGKGAAAGAMMSASMGPMGIAIGIAIDEGIGKDIDAAARKVDFDMAKLLAKEYEAAQNSLPAHKAWRSVTVERYGFVFKSVDGEERVVPELRLSVKPISGGMLTVHYPHDYKGALAAELPHYGFDQIKSDGDLVVRSLADACGRVIQSSVR